VQFFDDSRCAQRVHSEEHIVGLVLRAALSAFQGAVIFTTYFHQLSIYSMVGLYISIEFFHNGTSSAPAQEQVDQLKQIEFEEVECLHQ
jgi:hypothetical protein